MAGIKLGYFLNQNGVQYCTVYNSEIITENQKWELEYDKEGKPLTDIWNQIIYTTESDFLERGGVRHSYLNK